MAIGATGDLDLAPAGGRSHGRRAGRGGHQRELRPGGRRRHSCRTTRRSGFARSVTTPNRSPGSPAPWCPGSSEAGVLATLKHFPGSGEAAVDPHYELPVARPRPGAARAGRVAPISRRGSPPGLQLLMVAHQVVPALTGQRPMCRFAPRRRASMASSASELGFDGVVISDALDMGALDQGPGPGGRDHRHDARPGPISSSACPIRNCRNGPGLRWNGVIRGD